MLLISVRALPAELPKTDLGVKAVAVIDVLRATTVMATALHNGARRIYTHSDILKARELKHALGPGTMLCGERNGKRIDGFDLGNSPYEFEKQVVDGRSLIMCTTNGTKAVEAAKGAQLMLAMSFANLSAAAKTLLKSGLPIELLCAGTNGRFSLDDALCAGMAIAWFKMHTAVETDDLGQVLLHLALQEGSIEQKLRDCSHKLFLEASGYRRDVAFCLTPDTTDAVPVMTSEGFFAKGNNVKGSL